MLKIFWRNFRTHSGNHHKRHERYEGKIERKKKETNVCPDSPSRAKSYCAVVHSYDTVSALFTPCLSSLILRGYYTGEAKMNLAYNLVDHVCSFFQAINDIRTITVANALKITGVSYSV